MSGALRADHDVAFSYRRSTGGATARFLRGLADRQVWGSCDAHGRVTVPPLDWDPATGAATRDFTPVADRGTVTSWTWVSSPAADHPLEKPFALALIRLEGADTCLLHVVDCGDPSALRQGMPVRADWRPERSGSILDIRAFVPVAETPVGPGRAGTGEEDPGGGEPAAVPSADEGPVVTSDVLMRYRFEPGLAASRFLGALSERRIEGGRCPSCSGVYVPPRSRCPACRVGPLEVVDVPGRGTVVACTVVHVPFAGMTVDLPLTTAWIRLDGADVPFAHLMGDCRPDEVTVGQRVEAVWADDGDLRPSWESIRFFRPERRG